MKATAKLLLTASVEDQAEATPPLDQTQKPKLNFGPCGILCLFLFSEAVTVFFAIIASV
jgi:hypothetical protein